MEMIAGPAHYKFVQIFHKDLMRLIYSGYSRTKH